MKVCRKMNQDVNGNRKLFWKEVSKGNEVKGERAAEYMVGMGGWHFERFRCEGFGKNILKIFIM